MVVDPPSAALRLTVEAAEMSAIRMLDAADQARNQIQNPGAKVSDDKTKTGGQDRLRVSLEQDYEVRDWAEKFGVTEERLRRAVGKVGPMAADVERELKGG